MVDPVQYIFLNEGLVMTTGKAAAQAAHAAVEGYRATKQDSNILRLWYRSGHYKKIVLQARDSEHLWTIKAYLRERGIAARMIIDEGRTEIQPMTPTAIGVEILDKNHPHNAGIFSEFKLYGSGDVWKAVAADLSWPAYKPPTLLERLKGRVS